MLETRKLFHSLAQASSELNQESGITASMRAVMEALYPDSELTVPDIARQKKVTRQHIQQIVNELLARSLVASLDNPAHKRSPLIKLSPAGLEQFSAIVDREQKLLQSLSHEFDEQHLALTADTLKSLRDYLASDAWHKRLKSLVKDQS